MDLFILIFLGVIVVIVTIIIIIVTRSRPKEGDDQTDPLMGRLAESMQRGDVTSLEEIELSQPFTERVIIPVLKKLGVDTRRFEAMQSESLGGKMVESKNGFNLSVSYPRLLSKRLESTFLLQIFLAKEYGRVRDNVGAEFQDQEVSEQIRKSSLKMGKK